MPISQSVVNDHRIISAVAALTKRINFHDPRQARAVIENGLNTPQSLAVLEEITGMTGDEVFDRIKDKYLRHISSLEQKNEELSQMIERQAKTMKLVREGYEAKVDRLQNTNTELMRQVISN